MTTGQPSVSADAKRSRMSSVSSITPATLPPVAVLRARPGPDGDRRAGLLARTWFRERRRPGVLAPVERVPRPLCRRHRCVGVAEGVEGDLHEVAEVATTVTENAEGAYHAVPDDRSFDLCR